MMDLFRNDFGYDWPWTYGHAIAAALFALATAVAWTLGWRRWRLVLAALTIWAIAGAVIVNGVLRFSRPIALPTARFLASGHGRVLDAGAGSGRSSLMVLLARPEARVTALDIFATSYGISDNTETRLRANARAAGAADRLDVTTGDMRAMPFGDAAFDAAVSAFAIDHLNRDGVERSLAEMARVVRPGGDFLLLVVNPDVWVRTALPFFVHHGYFGPRTNASRWRDRLVASGFDVIEQGTTPGTLYLLARNRGSGVAAGRPAPD